MAGQNRRPACDRGRPETTPRSCGNQSAHQSPINRRLEASASCNAQPILLSPPRKKCARPTCLTTDLRITKDSFDSTCFETDTEFGPKPVLLFSLLAFFAHGIIFVSILSSDAKMVWGGGEGVALSALSNNPMECCNRTIPGRQRC